jgi:hypothetical protein
VVKIEINLEDTVQVSDQPRDCNPQRTMDKSQIGVRQHVSQEKMTRSEKDRE